MKKTYVEKLEELQGVIDEKRLIANDLIGKSRCAES